MTHEPEKAPPLADNDTATMSGKVYNQFREAWERDKMNGGELIRLKKRMAEAVVMLHDLIDGGEECRGHDSAISSVIRKLEGRP
jgi:hypothetical protein